MRALSALAAALAAGSIAAAAAASPGSVLLDERYKFCRDDHYPLTEDEHVWCPIVGETNERCPALPRACKEPPVKDGDARRQWFASEGGRGQPEKAAADPDATGKPGAKGPKKKRDERRRDEPDPVPELEAPVAMSGFAWVMFLALIAVFVVAVGRALLKNVVRGEEDTGGEPAPEAAPEPEAEGGAPRGPIETDVARLLARAREAAARGDYGRALDDTYAALLRRLDGDGLIEIHPSRTNGDYVRALRDRPDLRGAVREIVRDVERVQFGSEAPSAALFQSVFQRVAPLASRALAVLALLVGLSSPLSCASRSAEAYDGLTDTSPSGMHAVIAALRGGGLKVRYRQDRYDALDQPIVLVILPDAEPDAAEWRQILDWVEKKGGKVVIAGAASLPARIGVRPDGTVSKDTSLEVPPGVRTMMTRYQANAPPGEDLAFDGYPVTVLERGDAPYAVRRTIGSGSVDVLADGRLLTNIALAADANEGFLPAYFRSLGPTEIELCDHLSGAGARTPLESVDRAHLTPLVLQLLALLALFFLWKGVAFGKLRDPQSSARRAFADHARALGRAYARASASRHVLGLYAAWALERLRERVQRAGRQGLGPLAEAVAARIGRPEGEVTRILVEALDARDDASPASVHSRRAPDSLRGGTPPPAARGSAADLALMREIESFLAATGGTTTKPRRGAR